MRTVWIGSLPPRTLLTTALYLLVGIGCSPDLTVAPAVALVAPAPLMQSMTLLGPTKFAVPALNPGAVARETRFKVPAFANYVVRIDGSVNVDWNPALFGCYPMPGEDLRGSYGPGGGYMGALAVHGELINDRGQWNALQLKVSGSAAQTDTLFAFYPTEVRLGRNGINGVTSGPKCGYVPHYQLTSEQFISLELITGTHLRVSPAPVLVRRGTRMPFEARWVSNNALVDIPNWAFSADSGEASATSACGFTGPNPCWIQLWNNGWVAASRFSAGRMRGDRARVRVYDQISLEADRNQVVPGDTVQFTPMINGKPGGAPRWLWRPELGPATMPPCGPDGPCSMPVHESGSMWIYSTSVGGVADSAQAMVVAEEQFRLQATPAVASRGDTVTFAATLNGAPIAPIRWIWHAASGAAKQVTCPAGQAECALRVFGNGQLWAYRLVPEGEDSTSASVTVVDGGGSGGGGSDGGDSCGYNDLCDYVRLRVVRTDGIGGVPAAGDTTVPLGAVIAYSFHKTAGFRGLAVIIDSTLSGPRVDPLTVGTAQGSLAMDSDRTIIVGTDPDYEARPHVQQIRTRIRRMLADAAAGRPERARAAYLSYVEFALNDVPAMLPTGESWSDAIALAEYLEIDPVHDARAFAVLDTALRYQIFRVRHAGNRTLVLPPTMAVERSLDESGDAPSIGRRKARTPVFLYVNGIRTMRSAAAASEYRLSRLVELAGIPNAATDLWWNASAAGLLYESEGCGEQATRDRGWRSLPMAFARFVKCNGDVPIASLGFRDMAEAVEQKMRLDLMTPDNHLAAAADSLARAIRGYHAAGHNVIVVGHSQGNFMAAEAFRHYHTKVPPLQLPGLRCTAMLSLAAPVKAQTFDPVGADFRRGRTIDDDILQQDPWGDALRTDFPSVRSRYHQLNAPTFSSLMSPLEREWRYRKFGMAVHDVDNNYFSDPIVAPILRRLMSELHTACAQFAP